MLHILRTLHFFYVLVRYIFHRDINCLPFDAICTGHLRLILCSWQGPVNSIPNDKFLDWWKLEAFADEKINTANSCWDG